MIVNDKFGEPVTEERWLTVELAVQTFIRKYPLHWSVFKKDLSAQRTTYQLALEGDLKKSGFRNTLSFPVVYRRKTDIEKAADLGVEDDDGLVEVDSLYEILKPLLPGLTDKDEKGHPNKLYKEFLRRFPIFIPGERV